MRAKLLIILSSIAIITSSFTPKRDNSFLIYTKNGELADIEQMAHSALNNDVVLFGELHGDSVCHTLELKFLKSVLKLKQNQVDVGMEMFEADDQLKIDEYFSAQISQRSFENESRVWSNYDSDYKPLVETIKKAGGKLIASNIPRRYASMVYKMGLESLKTLSSQAKKWIAPLPIKVDLNLGCYKDMMTMGEGHGGENFPNAQAVKDATMAHFILKNRDKNKLLVHYNGNYHSKDYEGIYWYLKQKKKSLKVMTIATVYQKDFKQLEEEHKGEADYIICIRGPENN